MAPKELLIPIKRIERLIFLIRHQKVMLDADLARIYGVTTARLNQQVKRNPDRFEEKPNILHISWYDGILLCL